MYSNQQMQMQILHYSNHAFAQQMVSNAFCVDELARSDVTCPFNHCESIKWNAVTDHYSCGRALSPINSDIYFHLK